MYRVVVIKNPIDGAVIYVGREKQSGNGRYALNRLLSDTRRGGNSKRHLVVRRLVEQGLSLCYLAIAENLHVNAAKKLVNELREQHGVQLSRYGSTRPRVHQKTDPNSPYLDKAEVYYVYELIRPDTDNVFYVGKGSDRQQPRVDAHIRKAKSGKKGHKFAIIRKLLAAGLKPVEHRIAENLTESKALKLEVEHISSIGLNLLANDASGGQTAPTGDDHWTRRHPEKVLRGESHPMRRDPSRAARGPQNGAYTKPECRVRGAKHGMSKLDYQQVTRIRARYQEGLDSGKRVTGKRLAADYGVTPTQISRVLRGESWDLPNLIKKHGNAKLTKEQIASIPAKLAAGLNQKQLAEELGVSHSLINYYAKKIVVELVVN
jgi:transcriptional regulator with XRE-family HTH domain